jgi:hypothetical protein
MALDLDGRYQGGQAARRGIRRRALFRGWERESSLASAHVNIALKPLSPPPLLGRSNYLPPNPSTSLSHPPNRAEQGRSSTRSPS